jgi:hypothetical protein
VSRRESWIEQVRRRLADRPARQPLVADAARSALLVPLSVDAGELWTLLAVPEPGSAAASDEGPSFPSGPIAPGQEVWDAALAAAGERLGVAPGVVLRLGELEELEGPNGGLVTPCVGALPAGLATRPGPGVEEVVRMPLTAIANPQLVEQQRVETPAGERLVRAYHVGNRRVWGLAAHVLEDLLERLAG